MLATCTYTVVGGASSQDYESYSPTTTKLVSRGPTDFATRIRRAPRDYPALSLVDDDWETANDMAYY